MPKPKPFARIAITLPEKDLASADRMALRHDRSRSWIVAEAIRRYAADNSTAPEVPAQNGLGESRRAQLIRDLALTPEARVRAGEETARLTELRSKSRTHLLVAFDRYEDFLEWKRSRDLLP